MEGTEKEERQGCEGGRLLHHSQRTDPERLDIITMCYADWIIALQWHVPVRRYIPV